MTQKNVVRQGWVAAEKTNRTCKTVKGESVMAVQYGGNVEEVCSFIEFQINFIDLYSLLLEMFSDFND